MKQIKDVNILKDKIDRGYSSISGIGHFMNVKMIFDIIDSLAVEVPEAKPGAIKELIDNYNSDYTADGELPNEFFSNRIKAARDELAQLQADNEALEETVDEIATLNEKMNDEAIKLQADRDKWEKLWKELAAKSLEAGIKNQLEIKNLKGALRTLATKYFMFINKNEKFNSCSACEYADCCDRIVSCVPKIMQDALTHPTEEE